MARPKKEIDPEKVRKLATAGLTVDEIAAILNCHKRTLERRFAASIKEGRLRQNGSLKRMQHKVAMQGNVKMLIWLGIQHLGQMAKVETSTRSNAEDDVETLRDRFPVHAQGQAPEGG